ncbi:WD40 repeat domain-containing protein [Aspergillus aculeatinus CBS 121060]|uniref:Angio-associated migratory cell protein n=1 Tax=Aspergillus aculeatinus CBS 121060 TaxID=1448322 RepID=A0ACD1GX65_9EURO|nr:angio-associated migratory cell protein [Aspergillus aculeatinus CBS 121060]RAH66061.1 angio-associated migratory cell protein [Aspergillus aculeatinus CBS 121060]
MSSQEHRQADDAYIQADEAEEIFHRDEDQPMESDGEDEDQPMTYEEQEITLENDSAAHFDSHTDSVFCIAQHPVHNQIVITGSGDDKAYIFDSTPNAARPLLPQSYESNPQPKQERESLQPLAQLVGHTDTVNAVAFTEPKGEYVVTAGLDGKLRAYRDSTPQLTGVAWELVAETQEVEEINWLAVCPNVNGDEEKKNVVAIGANDGSAWVFRIDHTDAAQPISIIQTFFQHTASCTAGAWTPDGNLLGTVSEDGSFYVYDVFGVAAAAGVASAAGTSTVVGLTPEDQRFAVDGGLYSIAISPGGAIAAVGGAEGHIKVVGLPRLAAAGGAAAGKAKGKAASQAQTGASAAGTLLASLQAQSDGVETLSFSSPPLTLLAAGSVDGSIALFDAAHRFAVRRHIREAHEGAVVKVEFLQNRPGVGSAPPRPGAAVPQSQSWLLTTVGMDGIVRRWDARGGTAAAAHGLLKEWKGHLGLIENSEGEQSGGIMAFVQSQDGKRVVTAGDDGISLVFEE